MCFYVVYTMEVVKHDPSPFDINKICRTCLRDKGEMRSVFLADESIGQAVVLAEMIMGFSTVQVIFLFAFLLLLLLQWWQREILSGYVNRIHFLCVNVDRKLMPVLRVLLLSTALSKVWCVFSTAWCFHVYAEMKTNKCLTETSIFLICLLLVI